MKAARFLIDMSARCESCGTALVLSMPTAAVDKHNAVAHAFVAHSKVKVWLIDHAKTCPGAPEYAEQRPDDRGNWTRSHVGSTDHKSWCAFFRTVKIDPGGNAVGDCDCGAV